MKKTTRLSLLEALQTETEEIEERLREEERALEEKEKAQLRTAEQETGV